MSTNIAILDSAKLPASVREAMAGITVNELTENVGSNYAVLSIKGKAFRIKHSGEEIPVTMEYQGNTYAAPNFDAVIISASPFLSKTYYPTGYTEGSDESPTCWSEDGITPLAPLESRPIDVHGVNHCTDCRLCPMNAFGSKITDSGKQAKACADTRKVVLVPTKTVGADPAGNPLIEVDVENPKYGGPMLLRVPAASLSVVAEYSRKLQAMGVPYWAAVTRITFDQSVAYPKLVLQPLRSINDAEAAAIMEARNGPQVEAILRGGHATAALAPPQQLPTQAAPAPVPTGAPVAAPVQAAPAEPAIAAAIPQPVPVAAPAPVPAPAPVTPPAPVPVAAPVAAPVQPAPVQAVPPPVTVAQPAPAPATATAVPPPAPVGAVQQAAPPAATPASPVVSSDLLGRIDQMLAT